MSAEDRWVGRAAPAKINPFLDVLGRREDGYHEVSTTMLALDLADDVAVRWRVGGGLELSAEGPALTSDIPLDRRNLVWRAAEAALEHLDSSDRGLSIHLVKRVPSQAGLGGGSSDAAAVVAAIEELCGKSLERSAADQLFSGLGADCNFFRIAAITGFAVCSGRGEQVEPRPLDDAEWHIGVSVPGIAAPTAAVFGALDWSLSDPSATPRVCLESLSGAEDAVRCRLYNRLEPAALRVLPDLQTWRTLFDKVGAEHYRLSGSGSAFYGLFRDRAEAQATQESIATAAAQDGLQLRGQWIARPSCLKSGTRFNP